MQSIEKDILCVLLAKVHSLGLLSNYTYSKAKDSVHSTMDIPPFLRYPLCSVKEESIHECT